MFPNCTVGGALTLTSTMVTAMAVQGGDDNNNTSHTARIQW